MVVIVLISIYIIVFNGVFFFIITLFSSVITLPVTYGGRSYNGLLVVLGIKSGVCGLGGCDAGVYSFFI